MDDANIPGANQAVIDTDDLVWQLGIDSVNLIKARKKIDALTGQVHNQEKLAKENEALRVSNTGNISELKELEAQAEGAKRIPVLEQSNKDLADKNARLLEQIKNVREEYNASKDIIAEKDSIIAGMEQAAKPKRKRKSKKDTDGKNQYSASITRDFGESTHD